jgi:hypothetical protein
MTFSTAVRDNVRFWHKADILSCTAHVRFRGQSGHARNDARKATLQNRTALMELVCVDDPYVAWTLGASAVATLGMTHVDKRQLPSDHSQRNRNHRNHCSHIQISWHDTFLRTGK